MSSNSLPPNSNKGPPRTPRPRVNAKLDDPQVPPRPATTATTTVSGPFFAGSHNFEIHGAEFNYAAGNVYKTIRNDYSTRSNFDNSYGNDFSGSANLANNFHGNFYDNRESQSQQYHTRFMNTQFVFGAQGQGSPRQYEDVEIHGPSPQRGFPYQQQANIDGRPPTAPSTLESGEAVREREYDLHAFDRVYNVHAAELEGKSAYPGEGHNPFAKRDSVNADAEPSVHQGGYASMTQKAPARRLDIVMNGDGGDGADGEGSSSNPQPEASGSNTMPTSQK